MLEIDKDGMKKDLTITIGKNESAKYWMTVLNELKNQYKIFWYYVQMD